MQHGLCTQGVSKGNVDAVFCPISESRGQLRLSFREAGHAVQNLSLVEQVFEERHGFDFVEQGLAGTSQVNSESFESFEVENAEVVKLKFCDRSVPELANDTGILPRKATTGNFKNDGGDFEHGDASGKEGGTDATGVTQHFEISDEFPERITTFST